MLCRRNFGLGLTVGTLPRSLLHATQCKSLVRVPPVPKQWLSCLVDTLIHCDAQCLLFEAAGPFKVGDIDLTGCFFASPVLLIFFVALESFIFLDCASRRAVRSKFHDCPNAANRGRVGLESWKINISGFKRFDGV